MGHTISLLKLITHHSFLNRTNSYSCAWVPCVHTLNQIVLFFPIFLETMKWSHHSTLAPQLPPYLTSSITFPRGSRPRPTEGPIGLLIFIGGNKNKKYIACCSITLFICYATTKFSCVTKVCGTGNISRNILGYSHNQYEHREYFI